MGMDGRMRKGRILYNQSAIDGIVFSLVPICLDLVASSASCL